MYHFLKNLKVVLVKFKLVEFTVDPYQHNLWVICSNQYLVPPGVIHSNNIFVYTKVVPFNLMILFYMKHWIYGIFNIDAVVIKREW